MFARYDDWVSARPKKSTIALVEHEKVHIDQFRRDSAFKRRYLTSRKWRLQYEAYAYAKQVFVRVQLGTKRDADYYIGRYAKLLSSKTYVLFMSYDKVFEAIDREYEKLNVKPR